AVYVDLHTLTVQTSPITGASIALSPDDVKDEGGGISNFSRSYIDGTAVSLTAPETFDGYLFIHWLVDGVENPNPNISLTMDQDRTVTAVYILPRTLSVLTSPSAGASIALSPDDVKNEGGGVSNFSRTYADGAAVALTAPEEFDGLIFSTWLVDGVENANRSIEVAMTANHEVEAVFIEPPVFEPIQTGNSEYTSIQEAYDNTSGDGEIQISSDTLVEDLHFN
ncbi:MAG: hypothetical protein GY859_03235, partial [Desulfobacterales bacterium]|nr:hypothetical protein [Desulfobacterales bacterium]